MHFVPLSVVHCSLAYAPLYAQRTSSCTCMCLYLTVCVLCVCVQVFV